MNAEAKTDKDVIHELQAALAKEAAKVAVLEDAVRSRANERDNAHAATELANQSRQDLSKRFEAVCRERDQWKAKADGLARVENDATVQRVRNLKMALEGLRREVGAKDRRIADLTHAVDQAQAAVVAARQVAQRAEARANGMEASVQAMQKARDKAQAERGAAEEERLKAVKAAVDWELKTHALEKRVAQLEAAAKQAAKPAPVAVRA